MDELKVGKKYHTHNKDNNIDFDYEVIKIEKEKLTYNILKNRSKNISFGWREGIHISNYDKTSEIIRNSETLK